VELTLDGNLGHPLSTNPELTLKEKLERTAKPAAEPDVEPGRVNEEEG
jgi:hypothetical protein